jgi:hypothetical protein
MPVNAHRKRCVDDDARLAGREQALAEGADKPLPLLPGGHRQP